MRGRVARQVTAVIVVGGLAVAGLVVAASAESSLQVALSRRHDMQDRIVELQETRRVRRVTLHQRIRSTQARLQNAPGAAKVGDRVRSRVYRPVRAGSARA